MSLDPAFTEGKLHEYAQNIVGGHAKPDELALSGLRFCEALRRRVVGKASLADLGLLDANNSPLQALGAFSAGQRLAEKAKA